MTNFVHHQDISIQDISPRKEYFFQLRKWLTIGYFLSGLSLKIRNEWMVQKRYWIVVADGGNARIFKREEKFAPLHQIHHLSHSHESTHEHGRDRPGRVFESADLGRHAYQPKHDWHENQKHIFVRALAQQICVAYENCEFERLVLICPAHLVKDFKEPILLHMNEEEITIIIKDLTHHSLVDIQDYLDKLI